MRNLTFISCISFGEIHLIAVWKCLAWDFLIKRNILKTGIFFLGNYVSLFFNVTYLRSFIDISIIKHTSSNAIVMIFVGLVTSRIRISVKKCVNPRAYLDSIFIFQISPSPNSSASTINCLMNFNGMSTHLGLSYAYICVCTHIFFVCMWVYVRECTFAHVSIYGIILRYIK